MSACIVFLVFGKISAGSRQVLGRLSAGSWHGVSCQASSAIRKFIYKIHAKIRQKGYTKSMKHLCQMGAAPEQILTIWSTKMPSGKRLGGSKIKVAPHRRTHGVPGGPRMIPGLVFDAFLRKYGGPEVGVGVPVGSEIVPESSF